MDMYIVDKDTTALSRDIADYPQGLVIPVDKPYRWTSADVIRKVKFAAIRHFGKKNLKVGHAGTLDPLATGVLLVCIGNATKQAEALQSHEKEYVAGIRFGATTPSYDLEKEVDRVYPYAHIDEAGVRKALTGFVGEQEQIAPLFSAKSVDGVRAYEHARKLYRQNRSCDDGGAAVEAGATVVEGATAVGGKSSFDVSAEALLRRSIINISEVELLDFQTGASDAATECDRQGDGDQGDGGLDDGGKGDGGKGDGVRSASKRINVADTSGLGLPEALVRIRCSKGTYIRAFARDLGEALGSGAHLSSLCRSASGNFRVENAVSLERTVSLLTQF